MIRLASFLWLWFQWVCPLMPSCNTYRLTWVSLTLDVVCLFTAAPARCPRCSLPWTRGISSRPPPPDLERGVAPLSPLIPAQPPFLGHGAAPPVHCPWPWAWGSSSQPPPPTSGMGQLFSATLVRGPSQPHRPLQLPDFYKKVKIRYMFPKLILYFVCWFL